MSKPKPRQSALERVAKRIQDHEELVKEDYPLAYEVWKGIKDRPRAYGIEMVIDVLTEAERIQESNEDR